MPSYRTPDRACPGRDPGSGAGSIRHPEKTWIPAFAGMTMVVYLIAGVISAKGTVSQLGIWRPFYTAVIPAKEIVSNRKYSAIQTHRHPGAGRDLVILIQEVKMKKLLIVFLLSVLQISTAHAAQVFFDPDYVSVEEGSPFALDIVVSGLEEDDLLAFNMNINYDPSILNFDSYVLGTELTNSSWGQDDLSFGDDGNGTLNLSEYSWKVDFSQQPDSFTLATISFTAIAEGEDTLSISTSCCGFFTDVNLDDISTDFYAAAVSVTAQVPVPGSLFLLASGGVFVAYRRRRELKNKI